jgi:predicted membrane-bound mannosyltransferase
MTGTALPLPERSRFWLGVLGAAVLIGAWLRLEQIAIQVLINDEWHAVHQFIAHTPRQVCFDFGYADYSIPLGILDWYQAQWWGVSELTLRWPMLVRGLATLIVLPLHVAGRLGRPTAAVFALLIALSPLLVIFTRMARPYAITLLLGWVAHGAYQRYDRSADWRCGPRSSRRPC